MTLKPPETLITLITKVQQGDRQAYGKIVREYQNLAVGYAYSILGDFSLAEEAAQEAFIEAYLKLNSLLKPAAFPGWLKRIVFKHCDRKTRKKRLPSISLEQTNEPIATQPNPFNIAEQQELKTMIHQAIELLPTKEREAITLFYFGDRSQKEISAFLEVSVSTVKNRLFSARKKLKQNCNQTIEDYLSNQRPSMNDIFARKIEQIIEAACSDDLATVRQLLQQNSDLVNAQDSNIHTTALHCSAHRGYYNIVKLLVESGADVNTKEGNYSKSATKFHN